MFFSHLGVFDIKSFLLICFSIIVLIFLISNIDAKGVDVSIELSVNKILENESQVEVVVILYNASEKQKILEDLSAEDIKGLNIGSDTRWFSGYLTKKGLEKIRDNPSIERISIPLVMYPSLAESVPLIKADNVWDISINGVNITGDNQTVCVVDSGVNKSHPDLNDRIIGEYCICNITDYGSGGCCPNNQTYDNNSMDAYGHGTALAGIVASYGDLKGVSFNSNIVSVRVSNDSGNSKDNNLASGMAWCRENKDLYNIKVIVTSLGSSELFDEYSDAFPSSIEVNKAVEEGILVVVASGNLGSNTSISVPSCATNATSVGATYDENINLLYWSQANCLDLTTEKDKIGCGTNRGAILDILAPGASINKTYLTGYTESFGTSLAAPHVAGVATLLIQYEKLKNNRTLTPIEIEERFKDTGILITDNFNSANNGDGSGLTFPRIDAYAALFPMDVSDFQRVRSNVFDNAFRFKIKNNYNNETKTVSWSFDVGNGTKVNSNENITLSPKEEAFVFFEYNYTDGDIYNVNVTAMSDNLSDSEIMQLTIGDLIVYDLSVLYTGFMQRTFGFKIMNNMINSVLANWSLDTDENNISAINNTALGRNEEVFVYVDYDYFASGSKDVTSTATNDSYTDSDEITVNVS